MRYITKRAILTGSRIIHKGSEVPKNHPRLKHGLKRGWIVVSGGPAASPPPVKGKKPKPAEVEPEVVDIATTGESRGPAIDSLDIPAMVLESLTDSGIIYVGDLVGWDAERLDALRGIGEKTAEQLLKEFYKWETSMPNVEVDTGLEDEDGYDEDTDAGY